jgi:cytochrome c biogenesis factor
MPDGELLSERRNLEEPMDTTALVIFIIVAFSFGAILIMKRDAIAPPVRRYLALFAVVLIAAAFIMLVYAFLTMGG